MSSGVPEDICLDCGHDAMFHALFLRTLPSGIPEDNAFYSECWPAPGSSIKCDCIRFRYVKYEELVADFWKEYNA